MLLSSIGICICIVLVATTPDKPCGLPANLHELPDFAQDEIHSIWRDYVPGNRCEKEQVITGDILTVLSMFDKEIKAHETFKSGTKEMPKSLSEVSVVGEVQDAHSVPKGFLHSFHDNQTQASGHTLGQPSVLDDASISVTQTTADSQINGQLQQIHKNTEIRSIVDGVQRNQIKKIAKDYETDIEGSQQTRGKANDVRQFEFGKRLPFLQEASPEIVEVFMEVMEDSDIPSEGRRMEELHLLAVSYLNAHQLNEFNQWSTIRRKRVQNRERQLHNLSPRARDALKQLTLATDVNQARAQLRHIEPALRDELRSWGKSRERVEH